MKLLKIFLPIGLLFGLTTPAAANPAQRHILDFGINMGWAVSELTFQRADTTVVQSSIARARAHLTAAEALFSEPFRKHRARTGAATKLIRRLANYGRATRRQSWRYKRNYLHNIFYSYRRSLQYTYDSRRRPGGFKWQTTCDSAVAHAGYHFGRASIGMNNGGRRGMSHVRGALSAMRQAIRVGLDVALDGTPRNRTNTRKLCCSFGTPKQWAPIIALHRAPSRAAFDRARGTMQRLVRAAGGRSHGCAGLRSGASSPNRHTRPGPHQRQRKWMNKTNLPGRDYRSFFLRRADPRSCQMVCQREARCRAWTYVRPGVQGRKAKCWLKSSVPRRQSNRDTTSGIVRR